MSWCCVYNCVSQHWFNNKSTRTNTWFSIKSFLDNSLNAHFFDKLQSYLDVLQFEVLCHLVVLADSEDVSDDVMRGIPLVPE